MGRGSNLLGLVEERSVGVTVVMRFGMEVGLEFDGRRVAVGLVVGGGLEVGGPVGAGSEQLQTTL